MGEIIRLLKRDWPHLVGIFMVFIVMVVIGYFLPDIMPDFAKTFSETYIQYLMELVEKIRNTPLYNQIYTIWLNNFMVSLLTILMGFVPIPILPMIPLISNGIFMGLLQRISQSKVDGFSFYLALLPHGVFEIPAFFIAVYMGIRLSLIPYKMIWTYIKTKEIKPLYKEYLYDLKYYLILVFVLLTIAAVIEMTVSPLLISSGKTL